MQIIKKLATCRYCGNPVFWFKTPKVFAHGNKWITVEPDSVTDDDIRHMCTSTTPLEFNNKLHKAHGDVGCISPKQKLMRDIKQSYETP